MVNNVILIDDDESTNYLNKLIISNIFKETSITVFNHAPKALEYIITQPKRGKTLIFLDLNMPGMNGWEFMSAFQQSEHINEDYVIIILSSSINPDDQLKSQKFEEIDDFRSKPLSLETMSQIKEKFFPN